MQAIPASGTALLERARAAFEQAIPTLNDFGRPEELAEAEMNLGLVIQNLAGAGRARITDAISAYQRALRTFDRARFPAEFAILQNNLATAFLSMPFTDERAKMREALAVQAFEEGLKVVNLIDHPTEYAMLQNNLGNALQYASSSHTLENNLRALDAYDEALKVRTREGYAAGIRQHHRQQGQLSVESAGRSGASGVRQPRQPGASAVGLLRRRARSSWSTASSTRRASSLRQSIRLGREILSLPPPMAMRDPS